MELKPFVVFACILLITVPVAEAGFWQDFWDALFEVFTHSGSSLVPYPNQESNPKPAAAAPTPSNTQQATAGTSNYYVLHSDRHPLILVHGSILGNLNSFKTFQDRLQADGLYSAGPDLQLSNLNSVTCDQISRNAPSSFKVTYYDPDKNANIDGYSDRLNLIVQKVLQCTGASKVDIVAHSMGGLVSRASITKLPGNKVDKLIMLGTPNDGVYRDIEYWAKACGPECADMMHDTSSFLKNLKQSDYRYRSQYYTLAAYVYNNRGYFWQLQAAVPPPPDPNVDDPKRNKALDGDGAVRVSSVRLDGARNVVIEHNADCHHINLIDPNACPDAYSYVTYWLGFDSLPSSGTENTIGRSNPPPTPATPAPPQVQATPPSNPVPNPVVSTPSPTKNIQPPSPTVIPPPQTTQSAQPPAPPPSPQPQPAAQPSSCASLSPAVVSGHTITFNVRNDNCADAALDISPVLCHPSLISVSGNGAKDIPIGQTTSVGFTVSDDGTYQFVLSDFTSGFQATQIVTVGSPAKFQYTDIIVPNTPFNWNDKIPIEVKIKNTGTVRWQPAIAMRAIDPIGQNVPLLGGYACASELIAPQATYSYRVSVRIPLDAMPQGMTPESMNVAGKWEVLSTLNANPGDGTIGLTDPNQLPKLATWDRGVFGGRFITII